MSKLHQYLYMKHPADVYQQNAKRYQDNELDLCKSIVKIFTALVKSNVFTYSYNKTYHNDNYGVSVQLAYSLTDINEHDNYVSQWGVVCGNQNSLKSIDIVMKHGFSADMDYPSLYCILKLLADKHEVKYV